MYLGDTIGADISVGISECDNFFVTIGARRGGGYQVSLNLGWIRRGDEPSGYIILEAS